MNYKWNSIYCPYFIPDEIKEFGNYYSNNDYSDNEYIKSYTEAFNTLDTSLFPGVEWSKRILELQHIADSSNILSMIDDAKQQQLDMGWNPEVKYSPESQKKAVQRVEGIINRFLQKTKFEDICSYYGVADVGNNKYVNESTRKDLKPISIILVKGSAFFSDMISGITQSEFSHSAICVDNDFDRLYSFNLLNNMNVLGGFSLESIKNYPQNNRLAIFTFFVSEEDYKKINDRLQLMLNNIKNTSYSMLNILFYPFKHINFNLPDSMICSQFVDSMAKMVNADLTGKDSSKVTPGFLYSKSLNNAKIFKIFDGICKDFNPKKAQSMLNRLIKTNKAKLFVNEAVTLSESIFPIQFNKTGDLLLYKPGFMVDFSEEYFNSHKVMLNYEKTNNVEGMKYELAKLYYMNYIIEKKLYHNDQLKNKEKNIKTRARILNDFNKYLKWIIKREPGFNFTVYYENSPFYPHTVEVKSQTISKVKDVFKNIL